MILIWHVRFFDPADKEFKDRELFLDTTTLDPKERASIELCAKLKSTTPSRSMMRYRALFEERRLSIEELVALCGVEPPVCVVAPHDYIEDECGRETSHSNVAAILTGNPKALVVPSEWKSHDIEYVQSEKRPIEHDNITLSEDELLTLGYFSRDLEELTESAFLKDGPGRLYATNAQAPALQTAVNDEEIRSFVTIFRRLYMKREPASFCSAVEVFCTAIGDHPLSKWVGGEAESYQNELEKPGYALLPRIKGISFTTKRLIDVYLYTKFVHQPDKRRTRQFQACLRMWLDVRIC